MLGQPCITYSKYTNVSTDGHTDQAQCALPINGGFVRNDGDERAPDRRPYLAVLYPRTHDGVIYVRTIHFKNIHKMGVFVENINRQLLAGSGVAIPLLEVTLYLSRLTGDVVAHIKGQR